ncbi:hypothetical protein [Acinetobacter sp. c1-l78]|uniref:hypothetical protein n=1 Tax=Acinetobacter sp. c1-l78 TaxID=3342803 RepID=UPI0035B74A82
MKRISQTQQVMAFLRENANQKFTAREIAEQIALRYEQQYKSKKQGFVNEKNFINQLVAEIGRKKLDLEKRGVEMQDQPRPRLYWYAENNHIHDIDEYKGAEDFNSQNESPVVVNENLDIGLTQNRNFFA